MLIAACAVSTAAAAFLPGRVPVLAGRAVECAACATLVLWLPAAGLFRAADGWWHTRAAGKRGDEFLRYLDLHRPYANSRESWANSTDPHPLLADPHRRDQTLEAFAGRSLRRWHFYVAASLALAAWLFVVWLNAPDVPPAVVLVQVGVFALGFASVRICTRLVLLGCPRWTEFVRTDELGN